MLVCNICERKAKYRIIIDCGRFTDRLFFCEEHKPQSMIMGEMDNKQHDTNINTLLTTSFNKELCVIFPKGKT